MPLVSGPIRGRCSVAGAAGSSALARSGWHGARGDPGPRLVGDDGIDREELEAAEREVPGAGGGPIGREDGFEGDDWGPGAAQPAAAVS